jgi:hypothetical protein
MVSKRSNTGGPTPVLANSAEDRQLFDAMPKRVRDALIESAYDYNSQMVWDAFKAVKAADPDATDYDAWSDVITMVGLNDNAAKAKERRMYEDLVVELREEKQQRIDRAFQKAS